MFHAEDSPLLPTEAAVGCPLFLEHHCHINAGPGVSRASPHVLHILFANVLPNLIDMATISIHLADPLAMERRICHVNVAACRTMTFLSTNADSVTDKRKKNTWKC